jgi:two-component system chemotaxis sensor kinase CheA
MPSWHPTRNQSLATETKPIDDLLGEFLAEALEGIETLDAELVTLEQNPNDPALLGSIFRVLHTLKGTSGFLDLPRLESVAHAGENILGKFRDGELEVTPEAVTLILESIEAIKALVTAIGESGCGLSVVI